jgi:hypothetical protein
MNPREKFLALAEAAITVASREYQLCQLAAQHADLEGEDLVAAVLRAASEVQTAKVHALLPVIARLRGQSAEGTRVTPENLAGAVARAEQAAAEGDALLAAAEGVLDARGCDDVRAMLAPGKQVADRLRPYLDQLAEAGAVPA